MYIHPFLLWLMLAAYLLIGLHQASLLLRGILTTKDFVNHEAIKEMGWRAFPLIPWNLFLLLFFWPFWLAVKEWSLWSSIQETK